MEDLFKNQSNLQKQIKSSILEFNGFSFCNDKNVKEYNEDNNGIEEHSEEESVRELEVNRFNKNNDEIKGMSFGKKNFSQYQHEEQPAPKVRLFVLFH